VDGKDAVVCIHYSSVQHMEVFDYNKCSTKMKTTYIYGAISWMKYLKIFIVLKDDERSVETRGKIKIEAGNFSDSESIICSRE